MKKILKVFSGLSGKRYRYLRKREEEILSQLVKSTGIKFVPEQIPAQRNRIIIMQQNCIIIKTELEKYDINTSYNLFGLKNRIEKLMDFLNKYEEYLFKFNDRNAARINAVIKVDNINGYCFSNLK